MRRSILLACSLVLAAPILGSQTPAKAPTVETTHFKQWMDGQETGGAEHRFSASGSVQEVTDRDWLELARLGQAVRQEQTLTATRHADGSLAFRWNLRLSNEPLTGEATWSPAQPGELHVKPARGEAKVEKVPEGACLWPPDQEAILKQAARARKPVKVVTYTFAVQQWSTLELSPLGPDPLPGVPDAVRFRGHEIEGRQDLPTEIWVSPTQGEVRHRAVLGGVEVLTQRADLPAPSPTGLKETLFDKSLKTLPLHAFLPWLPEVEVRQEGGEPVVLAPAPEVQIVARDRWRLRRASEPTAAEAAQAPVTGPASAEDAPYLAPTPLVPFRDSAFDGLIRRLNPPAGASRWALTQAVNRFVYDWITDKDYSVGFASALEVAHIPKGDCTEHGVLAVALLRKLGVPARGAVGWVALDGMLGPHFWVEVKLEQRWVPVDPTFDQAPASAFRMKLGDTTLTDLGTVGWDAAQVLGSAQWAPTLPDPRIEGDQLTAPDGTRLRWPKGRWTWIEGHLLLGTAEGRLEVAATLRPAEFQLREARRLQGRNGRKGWWTPSRDLYLELGPGRWLKVQGLTEASAFAFVDGLLAEPPTSK
ncbi:MAG TPA: transglutaminase domain-containing protein [Holophagaceae bacterium]|nr:transglutaminase domain-containing protein [Holophagaceae bacterium]